MVRKHYAGYFMSEKQRKYILFLAKKRGVKVEISDFMSKREASKLISRMLSCRDSSEV